MPSFDINQGELKKKFPVFKSLTPCGQFRGICVRAKGWDHPLTWDWGGTGVMLAAWLEMGRMFSWSSITRQVLHEARDRMNLSRQRKLSKNTSSTPWWLS